MNDYLRDAWKYYEYGRRYNNNLIPNQYTMVSTNQEFFIGNQWIHMPDNPAMRRLAKPTFNIIKRVTSLFVASLTSSNTTISFEPLSYQTDDEAAAFATAEVRNLLEKFKMDYRIRDALFDGAITGDYAAHFFWNPEARPYGGAFGEYKGEIEINSAEVRLQTDTARQIADLRAQGEFEKADKVLEISNKYLSELQNLEKWAKEKNVGVQEFNAKLREWENEYVLNMGKYLTQAELDAIKAAGFFPNSAETAAYRDAQQNRYAAGARAMMNAGIVPSESQLEAMGWTPEQYWVYRMANVSGASY